MSGRSIALPAIRETGQDDEPTHHGCGYAGYGHGSSGHGTCGHGGCGDDGLGALVGGSYDAIGG